MFKKNVYIIIISMILLILLFSTVFTAEEKYYEIQNRYFLENYSFGTSGTKGTSLLFIDRKLKDIILFAQITYQDKFKTNESLQEIGGSFKLDDKFALRETLGFSSNKWTFPKLFSDTELTYNLKSKNILHFGYKSNIFEDAHVHIYSLGATDFSLPKVNLHVKVFHAVTTFDVNSLSVSNNSFLLKADYFLSSRHEFGFMYINNSESYLVVEELGKFRADTFAALWKMNIKKDWWLTADISFQKRKKPINAEQEVIGIGFIHTW
ncbi:MAG: YaiO family outer membrane beta-barrel protein [bacterium]|nr:YaiO family outer membrane beta-barrel protein [bacterium]